MKKTTEIILVFLLVISSFVFRVWEFDPWYSTNDPWIYYDNALKIFEGRPNLHMWLFPLGHSLVIAHSFVFFGVSPSIACLVSAVSGALSVLLVFIITRELSDGKTGLFSALIFSLSPMHVYTSSTILADTSSLFFAMCSAFAYIKFRKKMNTIFLFLCAVFTASAIMSRYSYWSLPVIYLLLEALQLLKFPKTWLAFWIHKRTIILLIIFLVFFTPQLYYNFHHFGNPLKPGYLDDKAEFKNTLSLRYF